MPSDPIKWLYDPAASGPRCRAFVEGGQFFAYEDGAWEVRLDRHHAINAHGREASQEDAKARTIIVFDALTKPLKEPV